MDFAMRMLSYDKKSMDFSCNNLVLRAFDDVLPVYFSE